MHLGRRWVISPCLLALALIMIPHQFKIRSRTALALGFSMISLACAGAKQGEANWPPVAKKWFDRAEHSYQSGDMEDAELAVENALSSLPGETRVKVLAAQIAMAELEFDRALQLLN